MTENDAALAVANFEQLVLAAKLQEQRALRRAVALTVVPIIIGLVWLAVSFYQANAAAQRAKALNVKIQENIKELTVLETQRAQALLALKHTQAASEEQIRVLQELSEKVTQKKRVPATLLEQAQQSVANATQVNRTTAAVVPRVGILIADQKQQGLAENVRRALEAKGFTIPAIRTLGVHGVAPEFTEVRYFHEPADRPQAIQLRDLLEVQFNLPEVHAAFNVDPSTQPNSFEIWFSPSITSTTRP
jgi:uncharacterized SAM-binding protein YcdF (DUF218 family)